MKKTKMLIPSLGLAALATTIPMVVTGCSKNQEEPEEKVINIELTWDDTSNRLQSEAMVFKANQEYCAIIDLTKWGETISSSTPWYVRVKKEGSLGSIRGTFLDVILDGNVLKEGSEEDYTIDTSHDLKIDACLRSYINNNSHKFEIHFIATERDKSRVNFALSDF